MRKNLTRGLDIARRPHYWSAGAETKNAREQLVVVEDQRPARLGSRLQWTNCTREATVIFSRSGIMSLTALGYRIQQPLRLLRERGFSMRVRAVKFVELCLLGVSGRGMFEPPRPWRGLGDCASSSSISD